MAPLDLQYTLGNLSFVCLLAMVVWYWLRLSFSLNPSLAPVGTVGMAMANLSLAGLLLDRWFTSGHFPLSNLYESLLFLSWGFTAFHLIMEATSRSDFFGIVTSPVALLTDAFASFSLPREMQKSTALVPALQSNWLMMHVTVMMISYVALISGSLLALAFLVVNYYDKKAVAEVPPHLLDCEGGSPPAQVGGGAHHALSHTALQPWLKMLEKGKTKHLREPCVATNVEGRGGLIGIGGLTGLKVQASQVFGLPLDGSAEKGQASQGQGPRPPRGPGVAFLGEGPLSQGVSLNGPRPPRGTGVAFLGEGPLPQGVSMKGPCPPRGSSLTGAGLTGAGLTGAGLTGAGAPSPGRFAERVAFEPQGRSVRRDTTDNTSLCATGAPFRSATPWEPPQGGFISAESTDELERRLLLGHNFEGEGGSAAKGGVATSASGPSFPCTASTGPWPMSLGGHNLGGVGVPSNGLDVSIQGEGKLPRRHLPDKRLLVAEDTFSPFAQTLDNLSYRSLGLGFPLLTIGILSGAVWANEAWGSYWSWDPKETWALVTWLVFAIYLHTRLSKGWRGNKPALIAVAGFFVVWICYLGVNLLGTGLHSYGWFQARG